MYGIFISHALNQSKNWIKERLTILSKALSPEFIWDLLFNKIFDKVLAPLLYKSLKVICFILFVLLPTLILFPGVFLLINSIDFISAILMFSGGELAILGISFIASILAFDYLREIFKDIAQYIEEETLRVIFNSDGGVKLRRVIYVSLFFFVILFCELNSNPHPLHLFALMLSIIVFLFAFYFTKYKETAHLLLIAFISLPFFYSYIEDNPEKFPHVVKEEKFVNVEVPKTYLDTYLSKYGMSVNYSGYQTSPKISYTVYSLDKAVQLQETRFSISRATKGIGKSLGASISSVVRASVGVIKFSTKPLVAASKPVVSKVYQPVKKQISKQVEKYSKQAIEKVTDVTAKVVKNSSAKLSKITDKLSSAKQSVVNKVEHVKKSFKESKQSFAKTSSKDASLVNAKTDKQLNHIGRNNQAKAKAEGKKANDERIAKAKADFKAKNKKAEKEWLAKANAQYQKYLDDAVNTPGLSKRVKEQRMEFANFFRDANINIAKENAATKSMRMSLFKNNAISKNKDAKLIANDADLYRRIKIRDLAGIRETKSTLGIKTKDTFTLGFVNDPVVNKLGHFGKHYKEFIKPDGSLKYKSHDEYAKGAMSLFNKPPKGTITRIERESYNGSPYFNVTRYNPKTDEKVVVRVRTLGKDRTGEIKTYHVVGPKQPGLLEHGYKGNNTRREGIYAID